LIVVYNVIVLSLNSYVGFSCALEFHWIFHWKFLWDFI